MLLAFSTSEILGIFRISLSNDLNFLQMHKKIKKRNAFGIWLVNIYTCQLFSLDEPFQTN